MWGAAQLLKQPGTGLEELCVLFLALYYLPAMLLGTWTPLGMMLLERNQFLLWPTWAGVFWSAVVYGIAVFALAIVHRWMTRQRGTSDFSDC